MTIRDGTVFLCPQVSMEACMPTRNPPRFAWDVIRSSVVRFRFRVAVKPEAVNSDDISCHVTILSFRLSSLTGTNPNLSMNTGWFPVPVIDVPLLNPTRNTEASLAVRPEATTGLGPRRVDTIWPIRNPSIGTGPVGVCIMVPATKHLSGDPAPVYPSLAIATSCSSSFGKFPTR